MAAPINVLAFSIHCNIIAGEQMLAYKSTQSSLKGLPQSTIVMATYSNDFKGANPGSSQDYPEGGSKYHGGAC